MAQTREDIVRAQLARSDGHWAEAVLDLREALLGMAGELDALERRVQDLERQRPADLTPASP